MDERIRTLNVKAQEICEILNDMADDLDEHNFKVNVSNTAGSAAAILGTGLSIAGGILCFFTFGAALPLMIAGGVIGTSGGITGLAASVADWVICHKHLKRAEEKYNDFVEFLKTFDLGKYDAFKQTFSNVQIAKTVFGGASCAGNIGSTVGNSVRLVQSGSRIGGAAAEAGTVARTVFTSVGTVGKVAHVGGLAVNVALLPLSIYELVTSSIDIHKKTGSPAGCEIRKLVEEIKEVCKSLDSLKAPAEGSVEKMRPLNAELTEKKNSDESGEEQCYASTPGQDLYSGEEVVYIYTRIPITPEF